MKIKELLQLVGGVIMSLMFGVAIASVTAVPVYVPAMLMFASLFIPKQLGVAFTGSLDLSPLPNKMKDYLVENMDILLQKIKSI